VSSIGVCLQFGVCLREEESDRVSIGSCVDRCVSPSSNQQKKSQQSTGVPHSEAFMSGSASSHVGSGSRKSAGNSRSDGRSNCRSDGASLPSESHGIKFSFGRSDQVPIHLQSMNNLADCAGTKMNNNMHKLAKKKVETTFPKPKAPGKDPAKHVVDKHRNS